MMTARRLLMGAGILVGLCVVGCQNPDKIQLQAQAEEITRLQNENADLRTRLAQAISERDALRNRVAALERENADLKRQLAAKPPTEPLPPGWKAAGPYRWTEISTDFLFDSGKATLRPGARAKLQEVVNTIQTNFPNDAIMVIGHTDTDPIKHTAHLWADNLDLSCNRGMTVYRELAKLGIRTDRMLAGGQGEYFPVASNATKAGKQQNRRVEIIAVPARTAAGEVAPVEKAGETPPSGGEALTPVPK